MLFTNRKATRPTLCSLLSTDPNSWFETSSKPIFNTTTVNGSSGELFFQRMKTDSDSEKEKLEQAQNDLSAWKFTSDRWCCRFFSATLNDLLTTVLTSYVLFTQSLFCAKWIRSDTEMDHFCSHGTASFHEQSVYTEPFRFWGSGGNKNRSSTTSDCLHVQKGRVLSRSPAYLYKTVYTLLLLLFFSFWDQHPKNVVDLYRRVAKRLHIN